MSRQFLSADWKYLAMANYEIDPSLLSRYVPPHAQIDLFKGKCYVSLVGFLFHNTRIKGIGIPYFRNFEEVNLRFYVKHFNGRRWKRGVVFIREIVPKFLIAAVANMVYSERYRSMPMSHHLTRNEEQMRVEYSWGKTMEHSMQLSASPTPSDIEEGSLDEFITEHYWGYVRINENNSSEYEVKHPRWKTFKVTDSNICCDFGQLYGKDFDVLDKQTPVSVLLAEGSAVKVLGKQKL